eukprot:TCONS_00016765-protein
MMKLMRVFFLPLVLQLSFVEAGLTKERREGINALIASLREQRKSQHETLKALDLMVMDRDSEERKVEVYRRLLKKVMELLVHSGHLDVLSGDHNKESMFHYHKHNPADEEVADTVRKEAQHNLVGRKTLNDDIQRRQGGMQTTRDGQTNLVKTNRKEGTNFKRDEALGDASPLLDTKVEDKISNTLKDLDDDQLQEMESILDEVYNILKTAKRKL